MNTQLDKLLDIASAISQGEIPQYQHNECFTSGAFDLLLINVAGAEAFELLRDACGHYQALKGSRTGMAGYYLLVSLLARQSNTTEMPVGMADIISEHPAFSGDLRQWYRYEG